MTLTLVASEEGSENIPSFYYRSSADIARSVDSLPRSVGSYEGKLVLYADYDNGTDEGIPLYLINDTSEEVHFESQDGDILLKLEYRNGNGRWVRAQAHREAWCGNSYFIVSLAAGKWIQFSGYAPTDGTKSEIRYSCYGRKGLVSNVGEGQVLSIDIEAAKYDRLSVKGIPSAIVEAVVPFRGLEGSYSDQHDEFLVGIDLISSFVESPLLRRRMGEFSEELTNSHPGISNAITKTLERDWPQDPQLESLIDTCVGFVGPESKATPAQRTLGWAVIGSILREWPYFQHVVDYDNFADMVKALIPRVDAVSLNERAANAFARVVERSKTELEQFPEQHLLNWVISDRFSLVKLGTEELIRREKYREVSVAGAKLSPRNRRIILGALVRDTSGPKRFAPTSPEEQALWESCFSDDLLLAVRTIDSANSRSPWHLFDDTVRVPLVEFLVAEANRTEWDLEKEESEMRAEELGHAVAFLGTFRVEEDTDLILKFLAHPALNTFSRSRDRGGWIEIGEYLVRKEAAKALKLRKFPVPEGVVYERVMGVRPPMG